MGQITLPGNPPIEVVLRRSARARRMTLRLSQLDGRVTLTVPQRVPEREAAAFAQEKEAWLRTHLDGREDNVRVALGVQLPVEGQLLTVAEGAGRRVWRDGDVLRVPGDAQTVGRRLQGHLKALARERLAQASDHYAAQLGRPYSRITLRDTRSRWGSCTSDGALMYSWRLILCPPEILNYVAAHEVAHLAEMNHSSAFWQVVRDLYGDWQDPRRWLRDNGAGLHRYRFAD